MNHTTLIFTVFSFLVSILIFAIWSNTHVFAQQLPPASSSTRPTVAGSSSSSSFNTTTKISPEIKAKMCNPSNPSLKVVNTTESRICGITKTVKPPLLSSSAAPPPTSAVSSPPPQTTTQPAIASVATPPKQQQQITTTTNNNTVSRSTGSATGAIIAPVSNPSNKSLSMSSPSTIAPQVKAVNQQQQQQPPIRGINSTAGQNYTFAATSPLVSSDKLLYLGYHGGDHTQTKDDSRSKH